MRIGVKECAIDGTNTAINNRTTYCEDDQASFSNLFMAIFSINYKYKNVVHEHIISVFNILQSIQKKTKLYCSKKSYGLQIAYIYIYNTINATQNEFLSFYLLHIFNNLQVWKFLALLSTKAHELTLSFGGFHVAHFFVFWSVCFLLFSFVFILCLVYPMFPVSLDYLFLVAPSVCSNVYFRYNLASSFAVVKTVVPPTPRRKPPQLSLCTN